MKKRTTLSVKIPAELNDRFRSVVSHFVDGKELWVGVAAAIEGFLRLSPEEQGSLVGSIRLAEVSRGVQELGGKMDAGFDAVGEVLHEKARREVAAATGQIVRKAKARMTAVRRRGQREQREATSQREPGSG